MLHEWTPERNWIMLLTLFVSLWRRATEGFSALTTCDEPTDWIPFETLSAPTASSIWAHGHGAGGSPLP
jgi:hypothetical protein